MNTKPHGVRHSQKKKRMVVTLDMKGGTNYPILDEYMEEEWGLTHFTPSGRVHLPRNTYMGNAEEGENGKAIRDGLRRFLRRNGMHATAIFGGVLRSWATDKRPI